MPYLIFIFCCFFVSAKCQQKCGVAEYQKYLSKINPSYEIDKEKVDVELSKWIENNYNKSHSNIITIPVVVHVLWQNSIQNISDAQILSQIDVLNQDYRRTNIDKINTPSIWNNIAADCQIEFCLASIDPNNQPTTGIERTQTSHGQFGMNSDVHTSAAGGADDWPNDDYLNIWVCDIQNGLLGYASGANAWVGDGDGLVIGYKYFGTMGTAQPPYNKGRTATHEIGHWLNLNHTWGDNICGDDQVIDTPKQEEENYGCASFPHNINSCGTNNINGDMFMNYMDYTNDGCMNLFTEGQKSRMIATINLYRSNMLNHNLCNSLTLISDNSIVKNQLIKIIDIYGKEIKEIKTNTPLFFIYSNGSVKKQIFVE